MARAILGEDNHVRNAKFNAIPNAKTLAYFCPDLPGLIDHPLVDEDTQVAILSRIDETGSAELCDLAAVLSNHEKPIKAILTLVRFGVLSVSPGLIDAHSVVSRATLPWEAAGGDGNGDDPGNSIKPIVMSGQRDPRLQRLTVSDTNAEIFCAKWSDRLAFRSAPILERPGLYCALYADAVYVGSSRNLLNRIVNSQHLREYGWPEMVIAAVDPRNLMTEDVARIAERAMARAVERDGVLRLANRILPLGGGLDKRSFVEAERFVRVVVSAIRSERLAFFAPNQVAHSTSSPFAHKTAIARQNLVAHAPAAEVEGRVFTLNSCGLHAVAQIERGQFVVKSGSCVRSEVLRSAGNGPRRQRLELLHDGTLVRAGRHLLLTRDLAFKTPSTAARFIVGCGHRGSIWRAVGSETSARSPSH